MQSIYSHALQRRPFQGSSIGRKAVSPAQPISCPANASRSTVAMSAAAAPAGAVKVDTTLNPLVASVKPSKTMALTDLATSMKESGIDVRWGDSEEEAGGSRACSELDRRGRPSALCTGTARSCARHKARGVRVLIPGVDGFLLRSAGYAGLPGKGSGA